MDKEISIKNKVKNIELLCLNIVDTINAYFTKYPKATIKRDSYHKMVNKITSSIKKIENNEIFNDIEEEDLDIEEVEEPFNVKDINYIG